MEMLKEIMHDVGEKGIGTPKARSTTGCRRPSTTKRKLMGFGHRVYKNGDHRAPILHKLGRKHMAEKDPEPRRARGLKWFELGEQVQKIMLVKKNIHPNVDFPCGMTYFTMGIPVPQYTPIFVAAASRAGARTSWSSTRTTGIIRPLTTSTRVPSGCLCCADLDGDGD
jgi:citrate synthase